MTQRKSSCSTAFSQPVYFQSTASVVGKKEGEGPLQSLFDRVCQDDLFGTEDWEAAESSMQKEAALLALEKAGLKPEEIRMIYAGDLLAQGIASSFGIGSTGIPFYGLYGACSTMGEALSLGAMTVAGGFAEHVLCATSSHFASAEKEFRFPLGYGNQRPLSATWTVTGSGACVIGTQSPVRMDSGGKNLLQNGHICAAITGITTGRIVDYGLKDSLNMGACMAPAACDTISRHLSDFGRTAQDYDAIFTGDLGKIGREILLELLAARKIDLTACHNDCGLVIYDSEKQDTHAGGSGCGCCASVLAAHILPGILEGSWNRILFVPTGAMLSKVSYNEGDSVPGIAHAVVIERYDGKTGRPFAGRLSSYF